jgi:hypothetical protein
VIAALPADVDRALKALPFAKETTGAPPPEHATSPTPRESRTPTEQAADAAYGAETAALPAPEEIRRLVAAAQPDAAMRAVAGRSGGALATARAEAASAPAPREENGTEAIDPDEVRRALVAFEKTRARAAGSPEVGIETLASIAVAIRSGAATSVAVARHGLTEGAWRSAQAAVVGDPAARARFEQAIERIRRAGK